MSIVCGHLGCSLHPLGGSTGLGISRPGDDGEVYETEVIGDPRFSGLSWSPDSRAVAVAARIEGRGQYGVHAIEPGVGMFQLTGTGNCVFPDWGREAG
jgi:hypothetical protein